VLLNGEYESAFCTENGSHSWFAQAAIDPILSRERQTHVRSEAQARVTQFPGHVLGRKGGKLTFGRYLAGDGTALASGVSPTDDSLQELLEVCLGASTSAQGGTTTTGSTTTSIVLSTGHGSRFSAGAPIAVEDGGGTGIYQVSVIESISTDTLTLAWALSNAPATGKSVVNSYCAYVDPAATATYQFQMLGSNAADQFLALGCVGGFSFADLLGLSGPPVVNFDLGVTEWQTESGTLAAGTFDGADPIATNVQTTVLYGSHGTSTRSAISISDLTISPEIVWSPLYARGNADHEHVDRWRITSCRPTASFTADVASGYLTDYEAQTAKRLTVISGVTPGSITVIDIPRVVISALPTRASHAEQTATAVQLVAKEDDASTATTALMRSPIRIARL
jgi:hypothetical protein